MTNAQKEFLFIEWALYDKNSRRVMLDEYQELRRVGNYDETFLKFLKDKFEIEGYWEDVYWA